MDEMQALRMSIMWPAVVGSAAFLSARVVFWFLFHRLTREHAVACLIVGASGVVVALAISVAWDDGLLFWRWFTLGMLALAVILLTTVVQLAAEMWRG